MNVPTGNVFERQPQAVEKNWAATRSPIKLAEATPWPTPQSTRHKTSPRGNYFDKHRTERVLQPRKTKAKQRKPRRAIQKKIGELLEVMESAAGRAAAARFMGRDEEDISIGSGQEYAGVVHRQGGAPLHDERTVLHHIDARKKRVTTAPSVILSPPQKAPGVSVTVPPFTALTPTQGPTGGGGRVVSGSATRAGSSFSDSAGDSRTDRAMRFFHRISDGGAAWRGPTARICVIA
jgi:hypothetical protein